ncbi:MAG: cytochrome C [Desulfobacterium sp.]|nr:cytochrome C [Desulfobacterium sp.]
MLLSLSDPIFLQADIRYTHHDFSYWGAFVYPEGNPNLEICIYCHTPHGAITEGAAANAPLWNHTVTSATYSLYASPTLNAVSEQPGGISKICLSCHDGTVAVDSHSGRSGEVYLGPPGSGFGHEGGYLGTDLQNDHPISIAYNSALVSQDNGLRDPLSTPSGLPSGGTITADMLFNGRIECSSCHDVHVPRYDSSTVCLGCHMPAGATHWSTPPPDTLSLRKSNRNSELCLTCHNK